MSSTDSDALARCVAVVEAACEQYLYAEGRMDFERHQACAVVQDADLAVLRAALAERETLRHGMAAWRNAALRHTSEAFDAMERRDADTDALAVVVRERDELRTRLAAAERCVEVMQAVIVDSNRWPDAWKALAAFGAAKGSRQEQLHARITKIAADQESRDAARTIASAAGHVLVIGSDALGVSVSFTLPGVSKFDVNEIALAINAAYDAAKGGE